MKPKGIAQRKARLDARRASLSREKLARLETTLQTVSAEGPLNTIPTRPIEGPVLCSFAQRRLWFLDQLNPGEVVYNLAMAVHLEGALSSDGLEQAVNEIVRRHESLRSSFLQLDGEPFQVIAPFRIRAFGLVDLGGLSETAALATSRRLAAEERNRPYDLSKDSLLRFTLLRAQAEKHAVFFTMHHIVSDAWSMGVFIREIGALYDAFCTGRPSPLRELPIQYADYSYWQRQWMQGELLTAEISYWARQLAGVSALELPIDRPRPAVQTSRGGSKVVTLSEDVTNRLRRLSRREDATMFMALLTAFQILLMRYSGSDDIAVGTPVAGRSRVETEGLIGFFINTLVIRTKLSGDPTLRQLVGRAREVVLDAQTHQHLPFERIVEELHPERSLSRSPIFQVMFSLPNAPGGALKSEVEAASPIDRLNFSGIGGRQGLVKFDLTLSMGELPDRLSGCFDYNADLFDDISIERMAAHFKNVIEAMVTAPDLRLSALSLLDDGQTHQLLTEWNDAKAEYERRLCVHELIEEQTNRTPDRIAVEFEEERLSYHELNARTDRLAQLLRSLGVRAEVIVGICLERSIELPVGLIGIWKAGGAYLPLEPSLPNARLLEMLGNAEAPVLVTSQKLSERLQGSRAKIVCLDADVVTPPSVEGVASGVSGESLAYLIYTSGSTGQPKGVMNTHRGLLNRLVWMQEQYGLAESDVVIQKTPFGFDVSVWEFFWPLMAGARLVMARPDGHKDSGYLVELITKLRVTTAHFVPSMLRVFIAERGVEKCKSLKRVICSGEAMVNDLYEKFSAQMRMPLENLYGPTEAAIDVTYWRCEGECNQRVIPIGRPVANTRIHIVDGEATPVGIAVRGELQIGGVQLARGYLKRPDLTAEKFVPDAVGTGIGERLYKTGDLACYRADGAIEFLGRLDHQVKIRGFRIELGEIEVVLSDHPWVREAVVIAREDRFGDRRLVAYVVGRGELESWEEEMSRYLRERLPEYMAPSVWVRIESLPLNQNGKIEKRALPEPEPAAKRQISTPSPPGPKCGSHSLWTWPGVSSTPSKMR